MKTESKNAKLFFILFDLLLFLSLTVLMLCKALKNGIAVTNILFHGTLFYWALALGFLVALFYSLIKICRPSQKALRVALFSALCVVACLILALIAADAVTSSSYSDRKSIPENADILCAEDVLDNWDAPDDEKNVIQVHVRHPWFGTTVTEVRQSCENQYFYSAKITSPGGHLSKAFQKEVQKHLSRQYGAEFDPETADGLTGSFAKDGQTYRVLLQTEQTAVSLAVYRQ